MARPLRELRSRAGSAALLVVSTLFSLVCVEGALRIYHAIKLNRWIEDQPPVVERALVPSDDPELVYEFNPGWSRGAPIICAARSTIDMASAMPSPSAPSRRARSRSSSATVEGLSKRISPVE